MITTQFIAIFLSILLVTLFSNTSSAFAKEASPQWQKIVPDTTKSISVVSDQKQAKIAIPTMDQLFEDIAINLTGNDDNCFLYTNKQSGYFSGQVNDYINNGSLGHKVFGAHIFEDFMLIHNGKKFDRKQLEYAKVYPHGVVRKYKELPVREETVLFDNIDGIGIKVSGDTNEPIQFAPLVGGGGEIGDFTVKFLADQNIFLISWPDHQKRTPEENYPVCLAIKVDGAKYIDDRKTISAFDDQLPQVSAIIPALFQFVPSKSTNITIIWGDSEEQAINLVNKVSSNFDETVNQRKERLYKLLTKAYFHTDDKEYNKALSWSLLSIDSLIMNQIGKGIWAGLYWFTNYWGRDSFISFPGATLVGGNFKEAKEIINSFSRFQVTDKTNHLYGRVANRVNSEEDVIYNTADGTPWFVREAYEYVKYSGDWSFFKGIFPVVEKSIDGSIKYRVDKYGFITHEDADTWMDAKIDGEIPWSARGDKAVDIQALWYAQLYAGIEMAKMLHKDDKVKEWEPVLKKVANNFFDMYWNSQNSYLYDHLNKDGSPDLQIRPNALFALTVPFSKLVPADKGAKVVNKAVNELTYPYGIASLSQEDDNFHPYHEDEHYHKDAAYHNGTVWVWNAGPLVSALSKYGREDFAYELHKNMAKQILTMGTVGHMSELIDAIPKDGKIKQSGTVSQAWSVAEYVRNFYQDYMGVKPDMLNRTVEINPSIPAAMGKTVKVIVPMGEGSLHITRILDGNREDYIILAQDFNKPININFTLKKDNQFKYAVNDELASGKEKVFTIISGAKGYEFYENGKPLTVYKSKNGYSPSLVGEIKFLEPKIKPGLKSIQD